MNFPGSYVSYGEDPLRASSGEGWPLGQRAICISARGGASRTTFTFDTQRHWVRGSVLFHWFTLRAEISRPRLVPGRVFYQLAARTDEWLRQNH